MTKFDLEKLLVPLTSIKRPRGCSRDSYFDTLRRRPGLLVSRKAERVCPLFFCQPPLQDRRRPRLICPSVVLTVRVPTAVNNGWYFSPQGRGPSPQQGVQGVSDEVTLLGSGGELGAAHCCDL
ncbi:hypothetical protein AOLI_G00190550 [Acnodon oligacanthus]